MLDKKADLSKLMRLCRSAALISLRLPGGVAYFALTARGENILRPRIGESSCFVAVGEDGGLRVLASEGGAPMLALLEMEDTD